MAQLNLDINSKFNGAGFSAATKGMGDLAKQAGKTTQTIGQISSALGGASGELGKVGGAFSSVGGLIQSAFLGPVGFVITAITTVVSLVTSWIQKKRELAAELETSRAKLADLNRQHERNIELLEAESIADKAQIQSKQRLEDLEKKLADAKAETAKAAKEAANAADENDRASWRKWMARIEEAKAKEKIVADEIAQYRKDAEIKATEDAEKANEAARKKSWDEYCAYITAKYGETMSEVEKLNLKNGQSYSKEAYSDAYDYTQMLADIKDKIAEQTDAEKAASEERKEAETEAKEMRSNYVELMEARGETLANMEKLAIERGEKDDDIQGFLKTQSTQDFAELIAQAKDAAESAKKIEEKNTSVTANQVADLDRVSDEVAEGLAATNAKIDAVDGRIAAAQKLQIDQRQAWAEAKKLAEQQGKNMDKLHFLEDGVTPSDKKTAEILQRYHGWLARQKSSATMDNLKKAQKEEYDKAVADRKDGKLLSENQKKLLEKATPFYNYQSRAAAIKADEETKSKLKKEQDALKDRQTQLTALKKLVTRLGARNSAPASI